MWLKVFKTKGYRYLSSVGLSMFSRVDNDLLEPNFISAKLNENYWNGVTELHINNINNASILSIFGIGNKQAIVFNIKFDGPGVYRLLEAHVKYYRLNSGGVITTPFKLVANPTSQMIITEYNSEQNVVKGDFEMSLIRESCNTEINNISLNFIRGRFKGTVSM